MSAHLPFSKAPKLAIAFSQYITCSENFFNFWLLIVARQNVRFNHFRIVLKNHSKKRLTHSFAKSTCLRKTGWRTVFFLFLRSKSRHVYLDRFFSGPYFRQEGIKGFKNRKQDSWQVFRQDREIPVLLKNLLQNLSPVFNHFTVVPAWIKVVKKACPEKPV